jgi:hypothetical protein
MGFPSDAREGALYAQRREFVRWGRTGVFIDAGDASGRSVFSEYSSLKDGLKS